MDLDGSAGTRGDGPCNDPGGGRHGGSRTVGSDPGERREWAGVVTALAAAVRDGWRAGATALWAAGRRREAVWLRADHHAAADVLLGAASGRWADVDAAVRRCNTMAGRSAAHPMLAAPWHEAARMLTVAAGHDRSTGEAARLSAPRGLDYSVGRQRVTTSRGAWLGSSVGRAAD